LVTDRCCGFGDRWLVGAESHVLCIGALFRGEAQWHAQAVTHESAQRIDALLSSGADGQLEHVVIPRIEEQSTVNEVRLWLTGVVEWLERFVSTSISWFGALSQEK
jgi:hypothetical protein